MVESELSRDRVTPSRIGAPEAHKRQPAAQERGRLKFSRTAQCWKWCASAEVLLIKCGMKDRSLKEDRVGNEMVAQHQVDKGSRKKIGMTK